MTAAIPSNALQDILARINAARPAAQTHVAAQDPNAIQEVIVTPSADNGLINAVQTILPVVLAAIQPILTSRKVTLSTATTVITAVSGAVATFAPILKGADARATVIAVFGYVWDNYLSALLPVYLKPFARIIKGAAVAGLQTAYDTIVSKIKK